MKTRFKQLLIVMSVLAVLVVLPAAVKADPITFTLDDNHDVPDGASPVTFFGSLSNLGLPGRFINGLAFSFDSGAPGTITFDDTAFFANVPAFLDAGDSTGLVAFFDAFVSDFVTPGVYSGSVSVLGGDSDVADSILATQDFTLTVPPEGQQPIPEPATMLLLGSGLAGAAALRRRKRRHEQTS